MSRDVDLKSIAIRGGLVGGPFGSSLGGKDYVIHGVPVIRGTNLGAGKYIGGDYVYVTNEKVESVLSRNTATRGDIIFTQRGTLGQVALVPESTFETFVISQSQMRLRVEPGVAFAEYVYYACRDSNFLQQVSDNAISTGVPHINLGILSRLRIPLPDISEQRAIAEVLGALDDKIAANTKLAVTTEQFAIALVAGDSAKVPLGEVVNLHRRTMSPDVISEPLVAHFSLPAFDVDRLPTIEAPRDIKSAKFYLDRPVVLLSKLNPRFPRVWNVDELGGHPALASTEFLVLEPVRSTCAVLWAVLAQPEFASALDAKVSGTSGSHQRVRPDDVLQTPVIDPGAIDVHKADVIANVVGLASRLRRESRTLAEMRDTLLPELMSGRLRVKDVEKKIEEVV